MHQHRNQVLPLPSPPGEPQRFGLSIQAVLRFGLSIQAVHERRRGARIPRRARSSVGGVRGAAGRARRLHRRPGSDPAAALSAVRRRHARLRVWCSVGRRRGVPPVPSPLAPPVGPAARGALPARLLCCPCRRPHARPLGARVGRAALSHRSGAAPHNGQDGASAGDGKLLPLHPWPEAAAGAARLACARLALPAASPAGLPVERARLWRGRARGDRL